MKNRKFDFNPTGLKELEEKGLELARNTVSAAEFIGDTLRAEGRHFGHLAYRFLTAKLTGHKIQSKRDGSLEPLAGVGTNSASVSENHF